MSTLVTIMRNSMQGKDGFISQIDDDDFEITYTDDVFIFNKCLKVKKSDFDNWYCYWEDSDMMMRAKVSATKLITGYTKIVVLDREIVPVSEVGEYNHSGNSYVISDKVTTKRSTSSTKKSTKKDEISDTEAEKYVKLIAESWGIVPKKN